MYADPSAAPLRGPVRRQGTILILVAGISALLLSLATAFLIQVRSDADGSLLVSRDAQARVMLSAALHYLQETSRLGWSADPAGEAYGWTDVRDGEAGPRGPRSDAGAIQRLGWGPGGPYPAEGGAMRGDLFCWELPPYAVRTTAAHNPLLLPDQQADPAYVNAYIGKPYSDARGEWPDNHDGDWSKALTYSHITRGVGALDPQPEADTWTAFADGRRNIRAESANRAWFRIYRERPQDHDGDGDPWYDTVPLTGHGVFIITCGAGSSRGFRFWDTAGNDFLGGAARTAAFDRQLEPLTAGESGWFDQSTFRAARSEERLMWFRVEWTAFTGGGADVKAAYNATPVGDAYLPAQQTSLFTQTAPGNDLNFTPYAGGAIKWIQRLEREPPRW